MHNTTYWLRRTTRSTYIIFLLLLVGVREYLVIHARTSCYRSMTSQSSFGTPGYDNQETVFTISPEALDVRSTCRPSYSIATSSPFPPPLSNPLWESYLATKTRLCRRIRPAKSPRAGPYRVGWRRAAAAVTAMVVAVAEAAETEAQQAEAPEAGRVSAWGPQAAQVFAPPRRAAVTWTRPSQEPPSQPETHPTDNSTSPESGGGRRRWRRRGRRKSQKEAPRWGRMQRSPH